jgi:hypothetical protein
MKVTYSAYQIDYFDKDLFEFYGFFPLNTDENKESKFFIKYTLIPPNSDLVDYMFDHYQSKNGKITS